MNKEKQKIIPFYYLTGEYLMISKSILNIYLNLCYTMLYL